MMTNHKDAARFMLDLASCDPCPEMTEDFVASCLETLKNYLALEKAIDPSIRDAFSAMLAAKSDAVRLMAIPFVQDICDQSAEKATLLEGLLKAREPDLNTPDRHGPAVIVHRAAEKPDLRSENPEPIASVALNWVPATPIQAYTRPLDSGPDDEGTPLQKNFTSVCQWSGCSDAIAPAEDRTRKGTLYKKQPYCLKHLNMSLQ